MISMQLIFLPWRPPFLLKSNNSQFFDPGSLPHSPRYLPFTKTFTVHLVISHFNSFEGSFLDPTIVFNFWKCSSVVLRNTKQYESGLSKRWQFDNFHFWIEAGFACYVKVYFLFYYYYYYFLAVNCGHPGKPLHGNITESGFEYNKVVTFHCNDFYELLGERQRQCQADGTWSGEQPTCVASKYSPPSATNHTPPFFF